MRRLSALLLICLMLLPVLSGCGAKAPESPSAPETQIPAETPAASLPQAEPTEAPTEWEPVTEPLPEAAALVAVDPIPVSTGSQTTVHVSTPDEFLAALASDTEIILDAELLNISEASSYGQADQADAFYWEEVFDGFQLTVRNLSNLTIRAEGEDLKAHTLCAAPRYAHVLNFENCSAITIEGFTAGHTIEPGYCTGGVIGMRNCENVLINRCGLYGCGVVGVWAEYTANIQVTNSDIYECSWGGIYMVLCRDVTFCSNTIRDLGDEYDGTFYPGTPYMLHDTTGICIDGQTMDDNYMGS